MKVMSIFGTRPEMIKMWATLKKLDELNFDHVMVHTGQNFTPELRDFPDLHAFYATEVVGRAQRLVCEILERGMETGVFRRMDALVAARMLSALFSTHGTWYHQKNSFKSIANIPDGVLLAQIRDFFLHALRPDAGHGSSHAEP